MKKSARVTLVFLSSFAAAAMNACGRDNDGDWVEAKRCVDPNNVVVEERHCEKPAQSSHSSGGYYHRYYYGGQGYYPGETVYGGSHAPSSGARYANPSHIARGGFGATGRAFVSHGSSGS